MTLADIIIVVLVLAIIGVAAVYIRKEKKRAAVWVVLTPKNVRQKKQDRAVEVKINKFAKSFLL